jgi:hypothetical protein
MGQTSEHFIQGQPTIAIDKIPKGTKPGDLPIEEPDKFELAINLRPRRPSASPSRRHLLRADQVID